MRAHYSASCSKASPTHSTENAKHNPHLTRNTPQRATIAACTSLEKKDETTHTGDANPAPPPTRNIPRNTPPPPSTDVTKTPETKRRWSHFKKECLFLIRFETKYLNNFFPLTRIPQKKNKISTCVIHSYAPLTHALTRLSHKAPSKARTHQ